MSNSGNILSLSHDQAREFFLRESSFCSIDLPEYFSFSSVLAFFANKNLDSINTKEAGLHHDVNYTLICNKDGKYAWRPLQIINPIIYIRLVNLITVRDNWEFLKSRFLKFQKNPQIQCVSIPVYKEENENTKSQQILSWWSGFEQKSIQFSLEYKHVLSTDITDCYGSIYTHSIAWSVHGITKAKREKRNSTLLGNAIDLLIEHMRFSQTNGISQGSVLMDFIAEIVLGYIDRLLSFKLHHSKITDYHILRYRDDFRIFVNDLSAGEAILKILTEILYDFGMRLNSSKTKTSSDIVSSSVKDDKRAWLALSSSFDQLNIQKKLFLIFEHSIKYPNCGSLLKPLNEIYKKLPSSVNDEDSIISIITDIAYRNPRTYPVCMAILAKLMEKYPIDKKAEIGEKILQKFKTLPNTEYLNVWLQRILYPAKIKLTYSGVLTQIVDKGNGVPWSFAWVTDTGLRNVAERQTIIDESILESTPPTIPESKIDIFAKKSDDYS